MASSAGKFALQMLSDASALFPQHNPETSAPGLPVKAAHLICQGVMVAYDPAQSQAQCADPAMGATARVIGFNTGDSVDNLLGAKGDLKTDADRIAGLLIGLDGDYVWIVVAPAVAVRAPLTVALTSSQNATTNGSDAGTTQTLANALKVSYNALQVDVAALRTALVTQGLIAPAA